MAVLKKNKLTKLTFLFLVVGTLITHFSLQKWNDPDAVISGDVRGYYAYLPAIFIHNDLQLKNIAVYQINGKSAIWHDQLEDGTRPIKYTYGMSLLYSPFFFLAHLYANISDYEAHGFSAPYKFALVISSLFYLFLAILFISKLLLLYFKDNVVALTLIILFLGTNALHYYVDSMTYSHGYSLAIIALFMYSCTKWTLKQELRWAIWIGFSGGLMVLIRPVDILFFLYPIFIYVNTRKDLGARFILFWQNKRHLIAAFICGLLVLFPQLLYFKLISGNLLHYSYIGESFYFSQAHLFESLFSYQNGWLIYTPIMFFSLFGIFLYKKPFTLNSLFLLLILLLYVYVISSWWCWWYVGFGNRAYINLYVLLSIPLAAFVQFVITKKLLTRFFFLTLFVLLIALNIFQTYQFNKSAIYWDGMTKEAYWDSFGRLRPSQLFENKLKLPDTEKQLLGISSYFIPISDTLSRQFLSFENNSGLDSIIQKQVNAPGFNGKKAFCVPDNNEFSMNRTIMTKDANRIYISGWVKKKGNLTFVLSGTDAGSYYASSDEVIETYRGWKKVHLYAKIPEQLENDSLRFYVWNLDKARYCLDDLQIVHTKLHYETKIKDW